MNACTFRYSASSEYNFEVKLQFHTIALRVIEFYPKNVDCFAVRKK